MTQSSYGVCKVAAILLALVPVANGQQQGSLSELPLQEVVLFNSGVGFFQHRGTVHGDAEVEMQFRVDDINDLLKSMVVRDLGGGTVSTVAYGSKDPIAKTLKSFAIDLTEDPTLADLLQEIRGQRVELKAPREIVGTIIGVETRNVAAGEDDQKVVEQQLLTLLTDDGLRRIALETVASIKLLDEKLDGELRKALALLARSHAKDKKAVRLRCRGQGEREIRMGYIQETPVWKTSYRLVLDDDSPLLQGWAIVENTTEQDWSGVQLTLVSGRPISFVMDLYQPLYVPRPQVQLDLYSSLRPQVYDEDMDEVKQRLARRAAGAELSRKARKPTVTRGRPARPVETLATAAPADAAGMGGGVANGPVYSGFAFGQGVASVAAAEEVGELFRYAIQQPVDLPRQQSAMLPIVNAEVKVEKLSIYNPTAHQKHPLNGLRLTNTTGLHLMQGPITVFDEHMYAGDAKIQDLPPGGERLISYALDLDLEVASTQKSSTGRILTVRLVKGTMEVERKYRRVIEYQLKNSADKPRTVLVEFPVETGWDLIEPKEPTEKTRSHYRFAVATVPGETAKLGVTVERPELKQIALSDIDDKTIRLYLSETVVDARVREALTEIAQRKAQIEQVAHQREQRQQVIQQIAEEQKRIRENMQQIDRASDLYTRYMKKFSDQEDQIEQLRGQIEKLQQQEDAGRKALAEYLMGLRIG